MVAGLFGFKIDGNAWIYKNKAHGMQSAVASLGLLFLWSVDSGLPVIDKYLYSTEDYVVAGALMAIGIVTCGVRNESEPALALLSDYVENPKAVLRSAAVFGYFFCNADWELRMQAPAMNLCMSSCRHW